MVNTAWNLHRCVEYTMYSQREREKKERAGAVVVKKNHIILVTRCFHYYIPPTKWSLHTRQWLLLASHCLWGFFMLWALFKAKIHVMGFFVGWYFVETPPHNLSIPGVTFLWTTGSYHGWKWSILCKSYGVFLKLCSR